MSIRLRMICRKAPECTRLKCRRGRSCFCPYSLRVKRVMPRSRLAILTIRLKRVIYLFAAVALAQRLSLTSAAEPKGNSWPYSEALLRPFWEGEVMYGESVLFVRESHDVEARASVLFPINNILAVENGSGKVKYV